MVQTSPGVLAYEHFKLSLRHGFVLLVPAAAVGAFYYLTDDGIGSTTPAVPGAAEWWVYTGGTVFCGAFLLGVPALLFGALRIWPMRWLLRICLAEPTNPNVELGLAGTLLLFESPLLIAAIFGASNKSIGFCALVSLPFLVGSLWATWILLKAEQLAATAEAAD